MAVRARPGWEMTVCEEDQRVGGTFRWEWSGPDGAGMTMSGVYREIVPPERCVRTEVFESGCFPRMGEQLATLVLAERGGKTTLTLTVLYPSKEARDGAIAGGMDKGWRRATTGSTRSSPWRRSDRLRSDRSDP